MLKELISTRKTSISFLIFIAMSACLALVANSNENSAIMHDHPLKSEAGASGIAPRTADKENPRSIDRKSSATVTQNKFKAAIVYNPRVPLGEQLAKLREEASGGNAYAICVLATALDLCVEQMMESDRSPWKELSSGDTIEKADDGQVEKLSVELETQKNRDLMCANVHQGDMSERDAWMLRSAMSGNPRSMTRFAMNPKFSGNIRLDDIDLMIEYRKSAESMLNRAAAAGNSEAILGLYRAYSTGAIGTDIGELKVGQDPAKAVGAARAILPYLSDAYRKEIESEIDPLIAKMDKAQQERMVSSERAYKKAYLSQAGTEKAGRHRNSDSPEAVCSSYAK